MVVGTPLVRILILTERRSREGRNFTKFSNPNDPPRVRAPRPTPHPHHQPRLSPQRESFSARTPMSSANSHPLDHVCFFWGPRDPTGERHRAHVYPGVHESLAALIRKETSETIQTCSTPSPVPHHDHAPRGWGRARHVSSRHSRLARLLLRSFVTALM